MKKANFIISHLRQQPSYEKLEQIAAYKKLFALLPNRLGSAIRFAYNKNQTLFIVLNNPEYKMEFNYKVTLIKSLLKELIKQNPNCKCIDAENIKIFVTNKTSLTLHKNKIHIPTYEEKSLGKFINLTKDSKLSRLFEEIRGIICSKIQ